MSLTTLLGYGKFEIRDFEPGELFNRFDGSQARIAYEQPEPPIENRFYVWIDLGTTNARKVLLHVTALAYATTIEQARAIEARKRKEKTP